MEFDDNASVYTHGTANMVYFNGLPDITRSRFFCVSVRMRSPISRLAPDFLQPIETMAIDAIRMFVCVCCCNVCSVTRRTRLDRTVVRFIYENMENSRSCCGAHVVCVLKGAQVVVAVVH